MAVVANPEQDLQELFGEKHEIHIIIKRKGGWTITQVKVVKRGRSRALDRSVWVGGFHARWMPAHWGVRLAADSLLEHLVRWSKAEESSLF